MKLIKHLITITKHRYYVMILCFKCGLYYQGLIHDLSKYSYTELKAGAKYYTGTKSPNGIEREKNGYSLAWLHHKGRNKHHWEYWTDYNFNGVYGVEIPIRYVAEMFCDRIAASLIYKGKDFKVSDPMAYYKFTHSYYVIHEKTDAILYDMLHYLELHDIDSACKYVKKKYLKK